MQQNEENSKDKSNKKDGNKENLEMLLDNNSETYQIMKNQRPKNIAGGKKALINYEENKDSEDIVIPKKTLKRSNSIKLYKKHKKEKKSIILIMIVLKIQKVMKIYLKDLQMKQKKIKEIM